MTSGSDQPSRPEGPPGVTLPPEEVQALREAGRAWGTAPPRAVREDGSIDPDLAGVEERGRPGERYVRVRRREREGFEAVEPGWLQATLRASEPKTGMARTLSRVRHFLLGAPRQTRQSVHERLTKIKALAVLSSDALSSVAYATEQILLVLVVAGAAAYGYSLPIMSAILCLLAIVVLSYRQTIRAYPKGGGSYIVASDNLGPLAGLVAGCSLITSYTLTVAVSVASSVDAIVSAAPSTAGLRVQLCAAFVLLLLMGNLRGIRESGSIFAAPTYLFILGMFVMVGVIFVKLATGDLHRSSPHVGQATESLTLVLILRAFASGATALTGVEAISDGVPAFRPPEWLNARRTLTAMGVLLGAMFLTITVATYQLGITPQNPASHGYQTVISQLAHAAFSDSFGYIYVAITTTAILVLAGNTAFSDFPRLLFFMARDDYAPHLFRRVGDRLAYSNGIIALAVLATLLILVFRGEVSRLIPLYAVGVFLAFTMSQAGMVARWRRLREPGWRRGLPINVVGVLATGLVFIITGIFKFTQGAWIIVLVVPLLVMTCRAIHSHYNEMRGNLATEIPTSPDKVKPICIVPIADLDGVALQSLAFARSISDNVIAVHVSEDEQDIARMRAKWEAWGNHVPLEIVESQYRALVRPLLRYIDAIDKQHRDDTLVVVLPELVATSWWHQLLHNQSALRLKAALLFRPGTVVVNVPYHLRRVPRARRRLRVRAVDDDL